MMLVPFVLGESGILLVVADVAWDVQSAPAEWELSVVVSLVRCLFSILLSGAAGSTMTGSVTREGLTEMPFSSSLGWSRRPGALAVAKESWS